MKVLDVGCGSESVAAIIFKDEEHLEVTRMDANKDLAPDVLHDITLEFPENLQAQFDVVYASHVLEHIDRVSVIPTLANLASGLKDYGELWVVVPSMEWAAQEILEQRDGVHIQGMIWGGQNTPWDYHRCGFTLAALRQLFEINGLVVRKAYQSPFGIVMGGREFACVQNVVIGARIPTETRQAAQERGGER